MVARRRNSQKQSRRASKSSQDVNGTGVLTETASKIGRGSLQSDSPKFMPGFEHVFAAIESLYADQLKPFGRILRKRVAESVLAPSGVIKFNEEDAPSDVDVKHLLALCEESDALRVEPEEGGDWSVLIAGRPQTFVDIYSSADPYSPDMWGAATAYFGSLSGCDMYLPGGRYSCAQALQARKLAFLAGLSLGQVCHIVQLAISQKKLIGYLNGAVVPYACSQSMLKEQCAQLNAPCSMSLTTSGLPENAAGSDTVKNTSEMATWETAREYLREILNTAAKSTLGEVGVVPLSNVKRLFRSKFHTELSETRLGHSKVSELFQDERFSDICTVQLQGHGYIVVQVEPQLNGNTCLQNTLHVQEGGPLASEPCHIKAFPEELQRDCCNQDSHNWYVGRFVQRTFIHASLPPPTPPPHARQRSASVPKDIGSDKVFWDHGCHPLPLAGQSEETDTTVDSTAGSSIDEQSHSCATSRPSLDEPVKVLLRECELSTSMGCMSLQESADLSDSSEDSQERHRLQFCPGEPLAFEEAGIFLDSAPVTQTPYTHLSAPRWPCLSPSLLARGSYAGECSTPGYVDDNASCSRLQFCLDEPLALEEAGIFLDSAFVTQTPYTHLSAPRWPCVSPSLLVRDSYAGECNMSCYVEDSVSCSRLQFCPDEPLALEEAGLFSDSAPLMHSSTSIASEWAPVSPSSLVRDGCVGSVALSKVLNTFIHSPLPPPTPLHVGARRRSRSLPKNIGSDKNTWEATCQALGYSQAHHSQQECAFNASDCVPTPIPHTEYAVPPSPDFPTYYNWQHRGPKPLFLAPVTEPPSLMSSYVWPLSSSYPPNTISLASLLQ